MYYWSVSDDDNTGILQHQRAGYYEVDFNIFINQHGFLTKDNYNLALKKICNCE